MTYQVVTSVEHFIVFLGHSVFLILTRPNAHNKNFPYHVRTTQIGILETIEARQGTQSNGNHDARTSTTAGNITTLDAFSRGGAYGVASPVAANMDIFTVEAVGSARSFAPSVPPPYSAAAAARTRNDPPSWASESRRKNSASAAVNGLAPKRENGAADIYDPNADVNDEDD